MALAVLDSEPRLQPAYQDELASVYVGDAAQVLDRLPAESVHCVVTSPPYWRQRDFHAAGQLGLEPTPEAYVARLVDVFRSVRRVLRSDGVLWLNLGDTYLDRPLGGLRVKSLVGVPWRVALALQADGWLLRRDVIWWKPNALPEAAGDRPISGHEYLFLLTRSERYHYDEHSPAARNLRSVWAIPTQPRRSGHRATFPERLVAPCLLVSTSARGCCPCCGAAWRRLVETRRPDSYWRPAGSHGPLGPDGNGRRWPDKFSTAVTMLGWQPGCSHRREPVPCLVLDPFCGEGTTLAVSKRLGRRGLGAELQPAYLPLIRRRLSREVFQVPLLELEQLEQLELSDEPGARESELVQQLPLLELEPMGCTSALTGRSRTRCRS